MTNTSRCSAREHALTPTTNNSMHRQPLPLLLLLLQRNSNKHNKRSLLKEALQHLDLEHHPCKWLEINDFLKRKYKNKSLLMLSPKKGFQK
jgi:hypothetical protein